MAQIYNNMHNGHDGLINGHDGLYKYANLVTMGYIIIVIASCPQYDYR